MFLHFFLREIHEYSLASVPPNMWLYLGNGNRLEMAADGHLGITALSRVTLASAGLSCY